MMLSERGSGFVLLSDLEFYMAIPKRLCDDAIFLEYWLKINEVQTFSKGVGLNLI